MAKFFLPSEYKPLKKILKVLLTADTILAFIPLFALIFFIILNQRGPFKAEEDYKVVCLMFGFFWFFQLWLVCCLSSLLKKYSSGDFYGYCFWKICLQGLWVSGMLALALNLIESEDPRPMGSNFLFGLKTFYVVLIPYQICELFFVIYFHYLAKKISNPADSIEVGVEIGVPPRGDVNLKV